MRSVRNSVLTCILIASVPASAYVVDQNHTPEIAGAWSIPLMGPVGQTFRASMSPLNVVELWISHGGIGSEIPADLTVVLREGSIDGPVLGESLTVRVEDDHYAAVQFDFPAPIALVAGSTYVIEAQVAPDGGNPMLCGSDWVDYPDGDGILFGIARPLDMWFRTGATEDVATEAVTWGAVKSLFSPR